MNFYKLIENRYSVRKYLPRAIEKDKLSRILKAARLAPTAANRQAFKIIVIHTKKRKTELAPIYQREWFVAAPVIIAVLSLPQENWVRKDGVNYSMCDAAIVSDHIILAATQEGLGTCWIGAFDRGEAKKVLNIPGNAEPMLFITLGYAGDKPVKKKRKPLKALIMKERWN